MLSQTCSGSAYPLKDPAVHPESRCAGTGKLASDAGVGWTGDTRATAYHDVNWHLFHPFLTCVALYIIGDCDEFLL